MKSVTPISEQGVILTTLRNEEQAITQLLRVQAPVLEGSTVTEPAYVLRYWAKNKEAGGLLVESHEIPLRQSEFQDLVIAGIEECGIMLNKALKEESKK